MARNTQIGPDWERFVEHVQRAPAHLTVERRQQVTEQARTASPDDTDLGTFCAMVAERSYRITEDEIAKLRRSGHTEDEIFEAIVVASVGAAQRRVDAVRAAIDRAFVDGDVA
jgi:hypothetical protein